MLNPELCGLLVGCCVQSAHSYDESLLEVAHSSPHHGMYGGEFAEQLLPARCSAQSQMSAGRWYIGPEESQLHNTPGVQNRGHDMMHEMQHRTHNTVSVVWGHADQVAVLIDPTVVNIEYKVQQSCSHLILKSHGC